MQHSIGVVVLGWCVHTSAFSANIASILNVLSETSPTKMQLKLSTAMAKVLTSYIHIHAHVQELTTAEPAAGGMPGLQGSFPDTETTTLRGLSKVNKGSESQKLNCSHTAIELDAHLRWDSSS